MKKIVSALAAFCILLSLCPAAFAAEFSYEEPVEPALWMEPDFSTDHAYSIALVGDTQCLSRGDYFYGTNKMEQLYGILADTAEERKLEHVFVLGDITDMGYRNDKNLGYAVFDPPLTGEWENAQKAILQLSEADISYSLVRGNHDDYMMDDYFNIPAYTDQFKGCGGFFSDSEAKHFAGEENDNPEGYVYWSAKTGYHENSIVNSYKTMEICGTKYLFLTVDHHLTANVINWVDEILGKYPDHLAIVATHAYIGSQGNLFSTTKDDTHIPSGYASEHLWENALKNHENVLAVVCGHVGTLRPVYSTMRRGEGGNVVRQILVDPQGYDLREENGEGAVISGVQDTGMILYMNFSEDGSKVTFDYYSTLLNKEMVDADYPLTLYKTNPVAHKKAETVNAEPASATVTTVPMQLEDDGGSGGVVIAVAVCAVAVAGVFAAVIVRKKKKAR
ncbi:MAG: hypothetical protein E7580_06190 [Ruminococcaceae bacterium]|nr:hypothetical protein [Oscillospiraceae bacterium]